MSKLFAFFYRSMLGQILTLTVIFLITVIVALVVIPVMEYEAKQDPIKSTLHYALADIQKFVYEIQGAPENLSDSEAIAKVKKYNPDLQYYIRVNSQTYTSSLQEQPLWAGLYDLPNVANMEKKVQNEEDCANVSLRMYKKTEKGLGYIFSSLCGAKEIYYEISGITQPVPKNQGAFNSTIQDWIWFSSKAYLITALGIFVIIILVVFITTHSIRRVAKVAQSFDPDSLEYKLPEQGLPAEVMPLVRAVNQMIGKIDEAKEQQNFFLSTAAHEMRTPLAILRTRIEELSDSKIKSELKNDISRLTTLVNDLLKLMSIKPSTEFDETVELVTLCKKVIAERAPNAINFNVELAFSTELETLTIKGDSGLLEVAIANLVDNAVSFSPEGSEVELTITDDKAIKVTDQGQGINPEVLPRLFDPFAKSPPNRDGHGLGLAIVKSIVSLHGAHIKAENHPEIGACFRISFP